MLAAILILITFSQLMLTPSASTLTEVINDVTLLKNELNTFMAQDGNTTEMSASGEFVRPPKVVDTTIIKSKLHELQNNITKLAEAFSNKNQNADDIKNRISSMEKQIEDLNKLYDNKDRQIRHSQGKFHNILSDLLAKYINLQQEIAKLQYKEFLEAIKHRYYQFAAVKIGTMENETSAESLIRKVYDEIGDLPPMLEFADNVNNLEMKLLIYDTIIYSDTFRHCHHCNFLLTCNKLEEIMDNNVYTGELESRFLETFFGFFVKKVWFTPGRYCKRYSKKQDPELVKVAVDENCLSINQWRSTPAIHDYSGYCYPIDSIYRILQE